MSSIKYTSALKQIPDLTPKTTSKNAGTINSEAPTPRDPPLKKPSQRKRKIKEVLPSGENEDDIYDRGVSRAGSGVAKVLLEKSGLKRLGNQYADSIMHHMFDRRKLDAKGVSEFLSSRDFMIGWGGVAKAYKEEEFYMNDQVKTYLTDNVDKETLFEIPGQTNHRMHVVKLKDGTLHINLLGTTGDLNTGPVGEAFLDRHYDEEKRLKDILENKYVSKSVKSSTAVKLDKHLKNRTLSELEKRLKRKIKYATTSELKDFYKMKYNDFLEQIMDDDFENIIADEVERRIRKDISKTSGDLKAFHQNQLNDFLEKRQDGKFGEILEDVKETKLRSKIQNTLDADLKAKLSVELNDTLEKRLDVGGEFPRKITGEMAAEAVGKKPKPPSALKKAEGIYEAFKNSDAPLGIFGDTFKEPAKFKYGSGHLHPAFDKIYDIYRPYFKNMLEGLQWNTTRVVVTGHSMGGGIASIMSCDAELLRAAPEVQNFVFNTVSAPPIGSKEMFKNTPSGKVKVNRVLSRQDPVTSIFGFRHPTNNIIDVTHKMDPRMPDPKTHKSNWLTTRFKDITENNFPSKLPFEHPKGNMVYLNDTIEAMHDVLKDIPLKSAFKRHQAAMFFMREFSMDINTGKLTQGMANMLKENLGIVDDTILTKIDEIEDIFGKNGLYEATSDAAEVSLKFVDDVETKVIKEYKRMGTFKRFVHDAPAKIRKYLIGLSDEADIVFDSVDDPPHQSYIDNMDEMLEKDLIDIKPPKVDINADNALIKGFERSLDDILLDLKVETKVRTFVDKGGFVVQNKPASAYDRFMQRQREQAKYNAFDRPSQYTDNTSTNPFDSGDYKEPDTTNKVNPFDQFGKDNPGPNVGPIHVGPESAPGTGGATKGNYSNMDEIRKPDVIDDILKKAKTYADEAASAASKGSKYAIKNFKGALTGTATASGYNSNMFKKPRTYGKKMFDGTAKAINTATRASERLSGKALSKALKNGYKLSKDVAKKAFKALPVIGAVVDSVFTTMDIVEDINAYKDSRNAITWNGEKVYQAYDPDTFKYVSMLKTLFLGLKDKYPPNMSADDFCNIYYGRIEENADGDVLIDGRPATQYKPSEDPAVTTGVWYNPDNFGSEYTKNIEESIAWDLGKFALTTLLSTSLIGMGAAIAISILDDMHDESQLSFRMDATQRAMFKMAQGPIEDQAVVDYFNSIGVTNPALNLKNIIKAILRGDRSNDNNMKQELITLLDGLDMDDVSKLFDAATLKKLQDAATADMGKKSDANSSWLDDIFGTTSDVLGIDYDGIKDVVLQVLQNLDTNSKVFEVLKGWMGSSYNTLKESIKMKSEILKTDPFFYTNLKSALDSAQLKIDIATQEEFFKQRSEILHHLELLNPNIRVSGFQFLDPSITSDKDDEYVTKKYEAAAKNPDSILTEAEKVQLSKYLGTGEGRFADIQAMSNTVAITALYTKALARYREQLRLEDPNYVPSFTINGKDITDEVFNAVYYKQVFNNKYSGLNFIQGHKVNVQLSDDGKITMVIDGMYGGKDMSEVLTMYDYVKSQRPDLTVEVQIGVDFPTISITRQIGGKPVIVFSNVNTKPEDLDNATSNFYTYMYLTDRYKDDSRYNVIMISNEYRVMFLPKSSSTTQIDITQKINLIEALKKDVDYSDRVYTIDDYGNIIATLPDDKVTTGTTKVMTEAELYAYIGYDPATGNYHSKSLPLEIHFDPESGTYTYGEDAGKVINIAVDVEGTDKGRYIQISYNPIYIVDTKTKAVYDKDGKWVSDRTASQTTKEDTGETYWTATDTIFQFDTEVHNAGDIISSGAPPINPFAGTIQISSELNTEHVEGFDLANTIEQNDVIDPNKQLNISPDFQPNGKMLNASRTKEGIFTIQLENGKLYEYQGTSNPMQNVDSTGYWFGDIPNASQPPRNALDSYFMAYHIEKQFKEGEALEPYQIISHLKDRVTTAIQSKTISGKINAEEFKVATLVLQHIEKYGNISAIQYAVDKLQYGLGAVLRDRLVTAMEPPFKGVVKGNIPPNLVIEPNPVRPMKRAAEVAFESGDTLMASKFAKIEYESSMYEQIAQQYLESARTPGVQSSMDRLILEESVELDDQYDVMSKQLVRLMHMPIGNFIQTA